MKVLFLDVDGVLNHHAFLVAHEAAIDLDSSGRAEIDPVAVARLRHVLETTGAKVCISSSWRHWMGGDVLRSFFATYGVEVVGATPAHIVSPRGEEISEWIARHRSEVDVYAVVDDYHDAGLGHEGVFVHTDGLKGLTDDDCVELIRILGRVG